MKMLRSRLSLKFAILYVGSMLLIAAAAALVEYRSAHRIMYEQLEANAEHLVESVEQVLVSAPSLLRSDSLDPIAHRLTAGRDDVAHMLIIDRSGRVLAHTSDASVAVDTDDVEAESGELLQVLRNGGEERRYFVRHGHRFFRFVRALHDASGRTQHRKVIGAFAIDMEASPVDAKIAAGIAESLALVLTMLVGVGVALYVVTRKSFVDPLERLAEGAREFGSTGRWPGVTLDTGDEIESLGRVLGQMATAREADSNELRSARAAAEQASRTKSEFLANMSHEIRTPMNGVMGMLELALDAELPLAHRELLEMAHTSAEQLLDVINDILDFSKVEAGRLELHEEAFAVGESLGETVSALALRAHKKGLELALAVDPRVPEVLVGDAGRLRQVVTNLVGNAIKFTREGEIVVSVEAEHVDEGAPVTVLHFQVRDTGIGIPEARRERIFEAFTQADSSTTREYGGTGLGLAISARLVALMGGRIWVESEIGSGSVFHFTARLGTADGSQELDRRTDVAIDFGRVRAMAVDDNATNRRILDGMLASWGIAATSVESGDAALRELARARAAGERFDLLIVDVNMPGMDGFSLVERIRGEEPVDTATILMLSSNNQPGSIARCRELNVAAYLTKPIKSSDLFDAIATLLGDGKTAKRGRPARRNVRVARAARGLHILLAEDNPVNQKLAVSLLERRGHEVTVVPNGRLAVDAVAAGAYDVVLMDVHMPEMGGFEATAAIRDRESASGGRVPIVAMTARAAAGDREACLSAGMDAYVSKPIDSTVLFETIERFMPTRAPAAAPVDGGRGEVVAGSPVDVYALRAVVGGDEALLRELVGLFLTDAPRLMSEIDAAIGRGDAEALTAASHALKGAAGTLAVHDVAAAAGALEELGRGYALDGAAAARSALVRELARAEGALRPLASPAGELVSIRY